MVRLAVAGLGAVTRDVHLPAYNLLKNKVTVVAACDPDHSARAWARQQNSIPELFEELPETIEKTRPDVVAICTPPAVHKTQVLTALAHGCHVFCEKPMVESLTDADEIIHAAQAADRWVVVNTQYPMMAIHSAAKRLLNSPGIGRLLYLSASQVLRPFADHGWRVGLRRRTCFEMGIHILELMRFFFAEDPIRIWAHMLDPTHADRDTINVISVEFADRRAASMLVNRISQGRRDFLTVRLETELASIQTSMKSQCELRASIPPGGIRPSLTLDFSRGGSAVLQQGDRSKVIATEGRNAWVSGTARNFEQFRGAIRDGKEPLFTARHHRNTLALVFAAYDSAETGRIIELSPYYQVAPGNLARGTAN